MGHPVFLQTLPIQSTAVVILTVVSPPRVLTSAHCAQSRSDAQAAPTFGVQAALGSGGLPGGLAGVEVDATGAPAALAAARRPAG